MAQPRYFITYYLKTLMRHVRGALAASLELLEPLSPKEQRALREALERCVHSLPENR